MNLLSGDLVIHDRSHWNFQNNIDAVATRAIRAFAMSSTLGVIFGIEAKMNESVVSLAGFHDDIATASAIATRRSATRNILLPAESNATVTTVAGFHSNFGLIDEHPKSIQKTI
jgi:hypothetical protein